MSEKKVGVCGKVLHSQAREIVANVINFMKQEATNGNPVIPLENFKKRVLAATGIGEFSLPKGSEGVSGNCSQFQFKVSFPEKKY